MAKTCNNCIYKDRKWGDNPCRTCMESGSYNHENWTGIDDEESESKEKREQMTDKERIEKLEKENEIMKKVLVMFISNLNQNGELINFDLKNKEVLEKLLGQLIL